MSSSKKNSNTPNRIHIEAGKWCKRKGGEFIRCSFCRYDALAILVSLENFRKIAEIDPSICCMRCLEDQETLLDPKEHEDYSKNLGILLIRQ